MYVDVVRSHLPRCCLNVSPRDHLCETKLYRLFDPFPFPGTQGLCNPEAHHMNCSVLGLRQRLWLVLHSSDQRGECSDLTTCLNKGTPACKVRSHRWRNLSRVCLLGFCAIKSYCVVPWQLGCLSASHWGHFSFALLVKTLRLAFTGIHINEH